MATPYQRTVPIGSVWDYTMPGTTNKVRVRVKGYDGANPTRNFEGDVYLVPVEGGAKKAHKLPEELRYISVKKFWEWVDAGPLVGIDSPE